MALFSYRSFMLSVIIFAILFILKSKYSKYPDLGHANKVEITPQEEEQNNLKKNIRVLEIADINRKLNILEIAERIPSIKLTMVSDSTIQGPLKKSSFPLYIQFIKDKKYYELD